MTKEEKELLLRDLSARLPYRNKVEISYNKEHGSSDRLRICSEGVLTLNTDLIGLYIEDEIYLKPYLRSLSSMTKDEKEELGEITCNYDSLHKWAVFYKSQDWLNKKMFDYRGLIPMGLAIEAPNGMYNLNKK